MIALRRGLLAAFVVGLACSITLAEGSLLLLTLLWLWRLRDAQVRRAQTWPLWGPVLAFAAATLLSAFASGHAAASIAASKGLLLMAALYVTTDALRDAEEADRFLSWLALAAGAAAVAGLVQVAACPSQDPSLQPTRGLARWFFHRCDRARAFFSIYMTLAGVLNLVLLATLPRLLPGGFRKWSAPVWLVTLGGLAMTYTRGAWIGLGAGAAVLLPMSRRGRLALLVGLALLPIIFLLGPQDLSHRFRSMFDPAEAGIQERIYMWRSGAAMWRERPLLGWGPGGVKREYSRYAQPAAFKQRTGHVHNTPLQILVERGVLGLAAWLAIWLAFYRHAIALPKRLEPGRMRERALVAGSIAAVTGFLVAGLSEYNFGDSEVVMVAWTIMALPWVVARELKGAPDA
ncbi:MAG TPA: O-antigen ligase family protein [Methylomirabilota bacterium]